MGRRLSLRAVAKVATALLAGAVVFGAAPSPAQAHTSLQSSDPAAGAELAQVPREIRLTFVNEVEPQFATVTAARGEDAARELEVHVEGQAVIAALQSASDRCHSTWRVYGIVRSSLFVRRDVRLSTRLPARNCSTSSLHPRSCLLRRVTTSFCARTTGPVRYLQGTLFTRSHDGPESSARRDRSVCPQLGKTLPILLVTEFTGGVAVTQLILGGVRRPTAAVRQTADPPNDGEDEEHEHSKPDENPQHHPPAHARPQAHA